MSKYINIEAFNDWHDDGYDLYAYYHTLEKAPSIDLDDYVPKEFHDKTCEAMAKRHQEEIADILERADADRPQGEWLLKDNVFYYGCCGKESQFTTDDVYVYDMPLPNFCPNCGARMKGADDE